MYQQFTDSKCIKSQLHIVHDYEYVDADYSARGACLTDSATTRCTREDAEPRLGKIQYKSPH